MNTTLPVPKTGTKIHTLPDGRRVLVAVLPTAQPTAADYVRMLTGGQATLVHNGARGRVTSLLKAAGVATRQLTITPGQWILFTPCGSRKFKN